MNVRVKLYDDDCELVEWALPGKYAVCPHCDGRGAVVNDAIDGNGLSAEDFDELGEQFREDYFSGAFDVTCPKCGGERVVPQVDEAALTEDQREAWDCHQEHLEILWEMRQAEIAEIRFGC